jgi:hypothetical protein
MTRSEPNEPARALFTRARIAAMLSSLLIACALGCGGPKKPEPEPEPEPEVSRSPMEHPEPDEVEPSSAELPVAEDFEQEAEEEITAETLRAQLDALEKEIGADF